MIEQSRIIKEGIAVSADELARIDAMMRQKGIFTEPTTGKDYYTGYEYATLYDWDLYFETLVQLYLGWDTTYARNGVEIFLDLQREDGHIQRSSKGCEAQISEHVKPFLAQISLFIYNQDGNVEFLRKNDCFYYRRMKKYFQSVCRSVGANSFAGAGAGARFLDL